MDNETKILLNRLVEEIGKLNSPDWWVIGITVVNALIMAWLGWRQYRLQKRMVRQQEYELYRQMYVIIKNVENFSRVLLNRIYEYFSMSLHRKLHSDYLEYLQEQINVCDKQLTENSIDFKFWVSYNEIEIEHYKDLVYSMRLLVQFIGQMEKDGIIVYEDNYNNDAAVYASRGEYALLIEEIIKRVGDDKNKKALKEDMSQFIKTREYVMRHAYIEKVEKHCKIE